MRGKLQVRRQGACFTVILLASLHYYYQVCMCARVCVCTYMHVPARVKPALTAQVHPEQSISVSSLGNHGQNLWGQLVRLNILGRT